MNVDIITVVIMMIFFFYVVHLSVDLLPRFVHHCCTRKREIKVGAMNR